MFRLRVHLCVVFCAGWVLACSTDAAPGSQRADAGSPLSAAADAGHGLDASSPAKSEDEAFDPPPNSSFESARALAVDSDTMQRVVNDAQVDYYSFEARAGVFYVVSTDVSRFSPNNVITLFDDERSMIAENDDGSLYPNGHVDARVVFRPEHSGTYYVAVEDRISQGAEPDGRFIPVLFYRLSLREITADTEGFALEQHDESPSTLRLLQDETVHTRYVTLLGDLSGDDPSDSYEIHGMPDHALIGQLLAAGEQGDSSTAKTVGVRVTADSDGHLLARGGLASGQTNIHPPVDDASYRIEISAGDQVGSNGFYAVDLVLLPDNPHERTEPENDSLGGAEPLALSGVVRRRGLLLSRLPAKDVDYYRFDAQAGELATVQCEGESGGSGVRGLKAELVGPSMQPLVHARESSTKALSIEPFGLDMSGTYYVKLSSETPAVQAADSDAVEPWARCAVVVGR